MKNVEYDDSKNKQEFFHGGQNLTRPFVTCQAFRKDRINKILARLTGYILNILKNLVNPVHNFR